MHLADHPRTRAVVRVRGLRRLPPVVALIGLAAVGALLMAGLTAPAAHAICKDPPCVKEPGGDPPPPPPPTKTAISAIAPTFAWSGDTITLTGTGFTGASVTIDGVPATITGQGAKTLTV